MRANSEALSCQWQEVAWRWVLEHSGQTFPHPSGLNVTTPLPLQRGQDAAHAVKAGVRVREDPGSHLSSLPLKELALGSSSPCAERGPTLQSLKVHAEGASVLLPLWPG